MKRLWQTHRAVRIKDTRFTFRMNLHNTSLISKKNLTYPVNILFIKDVQKWNVALICTYSVVILSVPTLFSNAIFIEHFSCIWGIYHFLLFAYLRHLINITRVSNEIKILSTKALVYGFNFYNKLSLFCGSLPDIKETCNHVVTQWHDTLHGKIQEKQILT